MSRSLRIPFIVDLLRTDDPAQIRAFAADMRLDRDFTQRGPLLNRMLTGKIRSVLSLDGVPFAPVAPRGDAERARAQAALGARLDGIAAAGSFDEESLGALAKAVRGDADAPPLELAVQQAVGRLFEPDYRASHESWAAARLLDRAVHTLNPLVSIWLRISGQIAQAQRRLGALVHDDRVGVHATGIAVHNLVRGFAAMRELLADPSRFKPEDDAVVARCLRAPESAVREARPGSSVTPGDAIRPGTLVVFDLATAQHRDAGAEIVFMAGSWAQCPAAAWVPAFIRAVWHRAIELQPPRSQSVAGPFRRGWTQAQAAARRAIYRSLLGANLVLQGALGLAMLAAPHWLVRLFALPPTPLRLWGVMLLILTAIYGLGWFDPIYTRWPNLVGILGRAATALVYLVLGGAFFLIALFDAAFAGALAWTYWQAMRAELMTRP
jgi:hypothetical protein